MRCFCVVAFFWGLLWVSPAMADSHETSGTPMASEEHTSKGALGFYYGWGVSASDENIARRRGAEENKDSDDYDSEDDSSRDLMIRSIGSSAYLGVLYNKKWKDLSFALDYLLDKDHTIYTATVTSQLPRSYLSISSGIGILPIMGHDISSPYLSYHKPFKYSAAMAKLFAPVEGVGEFSLTVVNDVNGDGWNNKHKSVTGIAQYKGDLGLIYPLVQFSMYDYFSSWVLAAGLKVKVENASLVVDYIRDSRAMEVMDDEDAELSIMNNAAVDVTYTHGMVTGSAEFAVFWRDVEDSNNPNPMWEEGDGEETKTYAGLSKAEKYANNMMLFKFGLDFDCMKGMLVPSITYKLKSHGVEPLEDDADTEMRMAHSITFAIEGSI